MLPRSTLLSACLLALGLHGTSQAQVVQSARRICNVESQYDVSNGTANDSPAINAAFQACGNGGVVAFAEGVDYNVYTPISATNLSDIEIQMFGNLHLPQNITYIQALYNETAGEQGNLYSLYWFRFSGPRIRYLGTPNVTTGWIKSYGQAWWDANPTNETGLDGRPHLMLLNTTDGSAQHLKSSKPIAWQFRLVGRNITVQNTVIESYSESGGFLYGKGFPFNTDGIQVAGTDITITDSLIYNGDDAFAIQSGAHNVTIQRATIGYASHGLSIGSLGQNQASFANVSNIVFDDITCVDTVYCARFKSWRGGQGLARNLTWQNIRAYNVTFPIFVTQTYFNQGSGQTQIENGAVVERPNNSSVLMENFTWTNWTGTIASYQRGDGSCVSDPCWYDVGLPDLQHNEVIVVECNTDTSCRDFEMRNIQLFPQKMEAPRTICFNATADLNPKLGFDCANATFVPRDEV